MLRGVIITNAYYNTEKTALQAERMKEELISLGAEASVIKNNGAYCAVSDLYENVFDFDFAIYFDKDLAVCEALEKAGVRVFNKARAIELCDDKMKTAMSLSGEVRMPTTVSCSFSYGEIEDIDEDYIDEVERAIGDYPYVVKKSSSSLGAGVFLVENREALEIKLKELSGDKYLVQQFIRESAGKDVRIIVIGGKAVACMKRESIVDFRSNAELGGVCKPLVAGEAFIAMAEKVAKILGLDYCGVDILIDDGGEPILCEVNSNAFFSSIERVTGVNVAGLYAKHVIESLKNSNERRK